MINIQQIFTLIYYLNYLTRLKFDFFICSQNSNERVKYSFSEFWLMALPQLIPSHSSSSSSLTHQPSISSNAVSPHLLNPNFEPFSNSSSLFQSRRFHRLSSHRCSASSFPEKHHPYPTKSDESVQLLYFLFPYFSSPALFSPSRSSNSVTAL